MPLRAWLRIFLTALALAATVSATADEPAGPTASATVVHFHAALIKVMKTPGFEARVSLLAPVVETDFDLSTIGRIAIGRPWRSLDNAEQQAITRLLHELVTTTYAARFGDYDGHAFNTLTNSPIADNREQVRTELITRSETVALDYMLIANDNSWKIYDVLANGVSDLALKRSNYASLIADGGIERVLEDIREGIARNRQPD